MLNIYLVGVHWNSQYRVQRYVGAHEGKTKINLSQRQKKTPKLQEQSYLRYVHSYKEEMHWPVNTKEPKRLLNAAEVVSCLHFNPILIVSFKIQCGGVQRQVSLPKNV